MVEVFFLPPQPLEVPRPPVQDIKDSAHYSIEDSKQKEEHDHKLREAKRKQQVCVCVCVCVCVYLCLLCPLCLTSNSANESV